MTSSLISNQDLNLAADLLVIFSSITSSPKSAEQNKKSSAKKTKESSQVLLHYKPAQNILANSLENKSITGKSGEVVSFRDKTYLNFKNIVVIGLGNNEKLDAEVLRQQGAYIVDCIKSFSAQKTVLTFPNLGSEKNTESFLQALVEGLHLSSYSFEDLKSDKKKEKKSSHVYISLADPSDKNLKAALSKALILAETVNFSRFLGDMPGNLMTPSILAQKAVLAAKGTGVKVTVWNKARIKKEKMGGLLGVSEGSSQEPRFIIMEYTGAGKAQKPVVFVGKGLTFDCGGISIKPSGGMEEMKYDMCGGANVIGTLLAIAKLKLKINVVGLVPSTENLAGPSATKPGDIHTARNGKTFEVNNTDAEGRLILADALSYASELKPKAIIDAATLTGAMLVALGNIHTGYFTRDKDLKTNIETAAEKSGEWVWNLPLTDFHAKDMKGTFADLSNISSGKGAGSATAAAFLEQFVGEGIPWAHFDIAGTGWAIGNRLNYCPKKGASGIMIRTFVELAEILYSKG
ncbi:MAG: leucyl aminopeptidase, partial [Pseudobdellovibrionaceae bacterium]